MPVADDEGGSTRVLAGPLWFDPVISGYETRCLADAWGCQAVREGALGHDESSAVFAVRVIDGYLPSER